MVASCSGPNSSSEKELGNRETEVEEFFGRPGTRESFSEPRSLGGGAHAGELVDDAEEIDEEVVGAEEIIDRRSELFCSELWSSAEGDGRDVCRSRTRRWGRVAVLIGGLGVHWDGSLGKGWRSWEVTTPRTHRRSQRKPQAEGLEIGQLPGEGRAEDFGRRSGPTEEKSSAGSRGLRMSREGEVLVAALRWKREPGRSSPEEEKSGDGINAGSRHG